MGTDTTSACDTVHVGIADHQPNNENIKVFSNPNDGKFTVWFNVHERLGLVQVYDVNGNLILQEQVSQWTQYKHLDISKQPTGIYFVKMSWQDKTASIKVIKE